MNLKISVNAGTPFYVRFLKQINHYDAGEHVVSFDYDSDFNTEYDFYVGTVDTSVSSKNIEVTKIEFDNFWQLSGNKVCIGENIYFAKDNNNLPVTDNNLLFFAGELKFSFYHPIYKFIHAG